MNIEFKYPIESVCDTVLSGPLKRFTIYLETRVE